MRRGSQEWGRSIGCEHAFHVPGLQHRARTIANYKTTVSIRGSNVCFWHFCDMAVPGPRCPNTARERTFSLCVEVRIRSAQPPSRGFSGSLATLTERSRTSPELRRQLPVILSDLTLKRASQRKNAAFLLVYLFWAVLGVTLANESMVPTIA